MVERVKITPEQILLKDSSGNIKFNTDNYYIKTGGGTLYAGGYDRAPAIYGQNTIVDHADAGQYSPGLFNGATFHPLEDWRYYWNVPKANSVQFRLVPDLRTENGVYFNAPTTRTLQYYNYDTKVLSNTGITYRWRITQTGVLDGDGNFTDPQWHIYPLFSMNFLPEVTNPNGGTYEVLYSANEYLNYERRYTAYDGETGAPFEVLQYGRDVYGARSVYDGESGYYNVPASTIYWKRNGIFTTKPAVALSLAVTP